MEFIMLVSTKGRYALRVMIDLAEHYSGNYIPLRDVAERQQLSLKYLERILPLLTGGGLIEGVHGKGGGYRLVKAPNECTVGEVLSLTEGDLAPVACLECGSSPCDRAGSCRTLPMWKEFHEMVNRYFNGIMLSDLMEPEIVEKYGI